MQVRLFAGSDQEVIEIARLAARMTRLALDRNTHGRLPSGYRYMVIVPGSRELVPALCPLKSDMIPTHTPPFMLQAWCHSLSRPGVMHVDQAAPWRYGK